MDERDYERRKQVLDEQLEAGIELLRTAYRAQRNALDLVWMASPQNRSAVVLPFEIPTTQRSSGQSAPLKKRRWGAGELRAAIEAALEKVPQEFDRSDLIAAMGVEPDRSSLYRIVEEMRQDGVLALIAGGKGQYASRYRKLK